MTGDKIFINGLIPKALGEKDPEFVMGKGSIHIEDMIKSLTELRQYAENGWINYQIFASKKDPNKRYAQLNNWKPQQPLGYDKFREKKEELAQNYGGLTEEQIDEIPFN